MVRSEFNPNLLCPLCGVNLAQHNNKRYISREHIPPKSIFAGGAKNLITVPSCKKCNAGTSKLDEEFKISMGLYLGHRVQEFWKDTLRTLNHPPKKAYKRHLLDNISPILTPFSGREWRHGVYIDTIPIKTVVTKTARGLHWYMTGEVLPKSAKVTIELIKQEESCHSVVKDLLINLGKLITINDGAFEAHYGIVIDRKYASMWLLRFYGEDSFLITIT